MQVGDSLTRHLDTASVYLPPDQVQDIQENPSPSHEFRHYHIFFVTGNPGCIEYYHDFLTILSHSLSTSASLQRIHACFHVYGHSLANFVDDAGLISTRKPNPILSLQEQIHYVEKNLKSYVQQHWHDERSAVDKQSEDECHVILVGHSVGTYISLEILSKLQGGSLAIEGLHIMGVIALFPTITWLARSPSGLKFGRIAQIPFIAKLIGIASHVLTYILPRQLLARTVKTFTGFPDNAVKTTVDFLASPLGVEQALCMALDEMKEITADKWDSSVWGVSERSYKPPPKLFFFFGENDHWVANHTRDELIAARGWQGNAAEPWKPRMQVDQEGIPHSFCIRHNATVAAKVVEYIQGMVIA